MDRFDDMRARVSASSEENGGAGGGAFGVDVMVQAKEDFEVGDTFVGTKITDTKPTIINENIGIVASLASADTTVIVPSQWMETTTTTLRLYIKKDDTYVETFIELPDMSEATTRGINNDNSSINEDGTKMIHLTSNSFAFLFEIDKENLTGRCYRIDVSDIDVSETLVNGYVPTPEMFNNRVGEIRGDYWFFSLRVTYNSSSTGYYGVVAKVSNGNVNVKGVYNKDVSLTSSSYSLLLESSGLIEMADGRKVLLLTTGTGGRGSKRLFCIFIDEQGISVTTTSVSCENCYITRNGRYIITTPISSPFNFVLYKIDLSPLALNRLTTVTGPNNSKTYVDETGEYWTADYKLYRVSDTTRSQNLGTIYPPTIDGYFDVQNGFIYNSTKQKIIEPTEAEYTIIHTTSVSVAGDIYGITPRAMQNGETNIATKIFNK